MKLSLEGIGEKSAWESKGYHLPAYDVNEIRKNTDEAPQWVHFGAGNIFRAYQALMNKLIK